VLTDTDRDEYNQLPEEGPPGQAPERDDGSRDSPARSSEAERSGQGESRGAEAGDESAQTGHPSNPG
jgi:hypothetical protein